jgi:hypothetical protein
MNTTLDDPLSAETVLNLVTRALKAARDLPSFYGLVRGLEIGISTLSEQRGTMERATETLHSRLVKLALSSDQYRVGVALGIVLTIDLAGLLPGPHHQPTRGSSPFR